MAEGMKGFRGGEGGASAFALSTAATQILSLDRERVSVSIRNNGTTTIFFGDKSTVTTATGYPLLSGEEYVFDEYFGPLYAVADPSGDLRVFEVR